MLGCIGWLALLVASEEPGGARVTTSTIAPLPAVTAPPPAPRAVAPDRDPAWLLYHDAFYALAAGEAARAHTLLRELRAQHPGHPAARAATRVLAKLAGAATPTPVYGGITEATSDGPATLFSRSELAVIQTLHGIAVGVEVCIIADCEGPQLFGGSMLIGGGAGLAAALLLTQDGITPGHTAALDAGTIWGGVLAVYLLFAATPNLPNEAAGAVIAGQLLGLGAGQLAWMATRASPGDVSLTSSGGLWTSLLGAAITVIAAGDDGPDDRLFFGVLFGGGLGGLAGGALLAHYVPMSRGRVFIIDGGGLVGTLVGVTVSLLLKTEDNEAFIAPALGMATGLGLTGYLTRNFDLPDAATELGWWVTPHDGGYVAGLGGRF